MKISHEVYATLPSPDTKPVAWSDDLQFDYFTREEADENCPFKSGDVIMVSHNNVPTKGVVVNRTFYASIGVECKPEYRVALITSRGLWSKLAKTFYPYQIQSGYRMERNISG